MKENRLERKVVAPEISYVTGLVPGLRDPTCFAAAVFVLAVTRVM